MGILTNEGFQIETFEFFKARLIDALKDKYPTMSTLDTNPLIVQSVTMAELFEALDFLNLDIYNSRAVKTAGGYALEKLVSILGLKRKRASASTGEVTFYGNVGVIIPVGTQIQSNTGITFFTQIDAEIGSTGEVDVPVTSVEEGTVANVDTNGINVIPFPTQGLNSVNNNSPFANAENEESDPELRERYFSLLGGNTKSTIIALYNALGNTPNVSNTLVIENDTHLVVNGDNPHSIHLYVEGGADDDIHQSIRETRAGGIWCMGEYEQYQNYRGSSVRSAFSRFAYSNITYTVTIQINPTFWKDEYFNQIKEDVRNAVNGRSLIDREFTFATLISATFQGRSQAIYDIEAFAWTFDGIAKTWGDTVLVDIGKLPNIALENINITLVEV